MSKRSGNPLLRPRTRRRLSVEGQGTARTNLKETSSFGLPNLGNTCYMNAVLSVLMVSPAFTRSILKYCALRGTLNPEIRLAPQEYESIAPQKQKYVKGCFQVDGCPLMNSYLRLLYQNVIFRGKIVLNDFQGGSETDETTDKNCLIPHARPDSVSNPSNASPRPASPAAPLLWKRIKQTFAYFDNEAMHDAHELLAAFLEALHREMTEHDAAARTFSVSEGGESDKQGDERTRLLESKETPGEKGIQSLIDDLFGLELVQEIKCLSCGKSNSRFQLERFISLVLSDSVHGTSQKLEDLIGSSFQAEEVEYRCEGCNEPKATKLSRICRLPTLLFLWINRSTTVPTTTGAYKRTDRVVLPSEMSLENWKADSPASARNGKTDKVQAKYRLKASILHFGKSPRRGHYVSYHKNFFLNRWVRHDDQHVVEEADENIPQDLHDYAYIILYEQIV